MSGCCPESSGPANQPACCAPRTGTPAGESPLERPWVVDGVETPVGRVPRVATELSGVDRIGAVRARLGIRRMKYRVEPGLYAVGKATRESPVLVSANYKLSFDRLRQELGGLDAWILVLDTKGINVWCAAGKGTFGTEELVRRIEATSLAEIVSHRKLIVPQLGAPGVAAHEVTSRSGFRVIYGPVRARDIPAFLEQGWRCTPEMRRVRFDLRDRLAVVPVDLVQGGPYALSVAAGLLVLAGLNRGGYDLALTLTDGVRAALLSLLAIGGGWVLAPLLLPWLPGRAFSVKGVVVGVLLAICALLSGWMPSAGVGARLETVSWFLIMPAISAFLALNFTGSSTYTSLSGVKREMRVAVPAQVAAAVIGLGLWLAARFY